MKVLELFAGTRSIGKAFERRGHEVTSIDLNPEFTDCIQRDAYSFTLEEMNHYDVIWASPDCSTYSMASGNAHRDNGWLSDYAMYCDRNNTELLSKLTRYKGLWFVENPRAGMRSQRFMLGIPRYTVTYCQYGYEYMKPTDIWTNHPNPQFKPPCKNGMPCHVSSPRGVRTGINGDMTKAERGRIPPALCDHIVDISEGYYGERKSL